MKIFVWIISLLLFSSVKIKGRDWAVCLISVAVVMYFTVLLWITFNY